MPLPGSPMKSSDTALDLLQSTPRARSKRLPYQDPTLPVSQRVEDLLGRMTIYEKIGQMTQLDITLINTTGVQRDVYLDAEKARDLLQNHHIGSFLNGEAASADTWFDFTDELMRIAVEETRLGIPIIYGIDHIHGASYLKGATIFPQSINLGATFDPEHARNAGRVTSVESADLAHHWVFSPVLDLGVNPLWARLWETYGEDPCLAARMGAAYVDGLQNNPETAPYRQAATAKHFLGYSNPQSGWDRTPAHLSMQEIHEFHRPSFQKAIDAGLKSIMINSGEINGVPVHASYALLTELLRNQMGFEGVIVTDWDDVRKLVNFHYTAENFTEATLDSVMAGIDVCMTPLTLDFNHSMRALVHDGRMSEVRIDASVRRILQLKFELGLFENPYPRRDRFERIGRYENRQKALVAARESIVLLKNKNALLPVKHPKRIGVFGPAADSRRNLSGGWTIAWQGGSESRYPTDMPTLFSALKNEYPDAEVTLFGPNDLPNPEKPGSPAAKAFIRDLSTMDLLVYAGGEEPYCEFAGNINDLRLPEAQISAVKMLSRATAPLLLVLIQGRPRLINDIMDKTKAIIHAGLPGFEGATAIANVISGRVNPSGRMPISYPMHPNHYLPYNHKRSQLYFYDPTVANHIIQGNMSASLFPFGYGLSYTTFVYSDLQLDSAVLPASTEGRNAGNLSEGDKSLPLSDLRTTADHSEGHKIMNSDDVRTTADHSEGHKIMNSDDVRTTADKSIRATVTVTNTGKQEGTETILWFTSTQVGRITRPIKELRDFKKVTLKPGESCVVTFEITPEQLSYPDENGCGILERTRYTVMVGNLEQTFRVI
jgi:beta-glucosidase